MSLFTRMAIAIVALVTATATIIGVLALMNLQVLVRPAVIASLEADAREAAGEIAIPVASARADLQAMLGTYTSIINTPNAPREDVLMRFERALTTRVQAIEHYRSLRLVGLDEYEIVLAERRGTEVVNRGATPPQQRPLDPALAALVTSPAGTIGISPVRLVDAGGVRIPVLTLAMAVRSAVPGLSGALVLEIELTGMFEQLAGHRGVVIHLVDEDGVIVLHPHAEMVRGNRLADEFPTLAGALATKQPQTVQLASGGLSVATAVPIELGGVRRVTLVAVPAQTALIATQREVQLSVIMGGTVAVLGAFVVALLMARSLTRPLAQIAAAVSGADHEAELPVSASGEVGVLARALQGYIVRERALQEALRQQSIRDVLTGLHNRRHFDESIGREIARAKRRSEPLALVMIDIDHFKRFNDTFGHDGGDAVLRAVGEAALRNTRDSDIICRFGGEELAVLMAGANGAAALGRAEALRAAVEQLAVSHDGKLLGRVTASFGVAVYPVDAETIEDLVSAADHALYRAKENGRNRVEIGRVAPRRAAVG